MNHRLGISLTLSVGLGLLLSVLGAGVATAQGVSGGGLTNLQKRHVSGVVSVGLDSEVASSQASVRASVRASVNAQALGALAASAAPNALPAPGGKCAVTRGSNVEVNQDCLNLSDGDLQGRSQAQNETSVAQDPNAPDHLVAGFNDYRRGDGTCGISWSVNGGATWQDSTLPTGFVRGTTFGGVAREYFNAGGDPSVAWDTKGNAYFNCQMFMRGPPTTNNPDESSGVYLFRSTGTLGASWNFTGRPVVQTFEADPSFPNGIVLIDKPYMTVDNARGSPFQDRIYVTWTSFATDGSGYIYSAYSADYGETFSTPVVVSGNNSALCIVTFGAGTPQGNCNENQFSQPFTGSDGTLYVVWANYNNTVTGADNRNQMLLATSTNGGVSFSTPVKVADYYELPDCATYQAGRDAGRACVPEKGAATNSVFRAANYPSAAVDPTNPNRIVVAFGSYIGPHSNEANGCVPAGFAPSGNNAYTGVKAAGACKNDILVSVSTNGGGSFTGTTTDPRSLRSAASTRAQATTDQWFQWLAFTEDGQLAISYYDRQYGNDETTGFSDVSVSGSRDFSHFAVRRVSSSSMPLPTEFPDALGGGLFWGDYTGLTALGQAHPTWSDTRAAEVFLCAGTGVFGVPPAVCSPGASIANDQDIYTASTPVPSPDE
jgi:hypothetical protein